MEGVNWDRISSMVHFPFGMSESEKRHRDQMKRDIMDRVALNISSGVAVDVFQRSLLSEGWDEALLVTLRAEEAPNQVNRAAANLESANCSQLSQLTNNKSNQSNEIETEPQQKQHQVDDTASEACARQRKRKSLHDEEHSTPEYDESEMSRKSPGDRKFLRNSNQEVVDLTDAPEPPVQAEEEVADSEDSLVGRPAKGWHEAVIAARGKSRTEFRYR